jgi:hypothetical protein
MALVDLPTEEDLAVWMGFPATSPVRGALVPHVQAVIAFARSYTRGVGFEDEQCEEDLRAVILSGAARLASNPSGAHRVEAGSYNQMPGQFAGWNLLELSVLHAYRRRAA